MSKHSTDRTEPTRPTEMTFDDSQELDDDIVLRQLRELTAQLRCFNQRLDKKLITKVWGPPTTDACRVRFYDKPRRPARNNCRQCEARKDSINNEDKRIDDEQKILANNQLRLRQHEEKIVNRRRRRSTAGQ